METDRRELESFFLSQIEERGPIPFSQFMEGCLYHPQYGYYRTMGKKVGAEGDYYSSPCVHPLFGHLVSRQLAQMAERLGEETFEAVEMGAGRGFLCKDILDWAERFAPSFYHRLRYTLVESSPIFVEEQTQRLSHHAQRGKVSWLDQEAFQKTGEPVRGCFLSNELIDAFPVHRVVVDQGKLKEIYVTYENGHWAEQEGNLSDSRLSDYFAALGIRLAEGQKAEVNLKALEWMEWVGHRLNAGFVLTVDYGYLAEELYAPHRREGTLLCYFQHRVSENPYERIGQQDMTSHVNFTSLIRRGQEVGLEVTGLVPQYRFLIGLGLLREMESIGRELPPMEGLKLRLSLKHLIDPEAGMGEVFKVLIQHKGIPYPPLDGLKDLEAVPWPSSEEGSNA